ncbi:MAG: hypothetical protein ACRENQ_12655, partial [Gemmatimonadaceae bacterium]
MTRFDPRTVTRRPVDVPPLAPGGRGPSALVRGVGYAAHAALMALTLSACFPAVTHGPRVTAGWDNGASVSLPAYD